MDCGEAHNTIMRIDRESGEGAGDGRNLGGADAKHVLSNAHNLAGSTSRSLALR